MSQPIPNPNFSPALGLTPSVAAQAAPLPAPPVAPAQARVSGPASYTNMPDGSWADAQVSLSSSSSEPTPEEQKQMQAFEQMLIGRQMSLMQQRAAFNHKQAMNALKNNSVSAEVKLVSPPDLKSMFAEEGGEADGGGEGGEGGE